MDIMGIYSTDGNHSSDSADGKGSFLIAGYNTSRSKEKYNENRL